MPFNGELVNKTMVELRNAIDTCRSATTADIDVNALQLILTHAMVDLSLAQEAVTDLAARQDALSGEVERLQAEVEALKNPQDEVKEDGAKD
jgi:prefoldin subunit 5